MERCTQECGKLASLARQGWYVVAACALMTSQPFLTSLSKNSDGAYDYSPVSTTFIVAFLKLLISLTCYLLLPRAEKSHSVLRWRDGFLFAIPAFVYFVNNNLIFLILIYVNSTTYQILSSLKTVFTGILFRVILKRVLSDIQANSILLLACGAAVSQFPICPSVCNEEGEMEESVLAGAPALLGAIIALFACLLSAFGGVYSELLLKKDGNLHSIHLQNLLLYGWGIVFNGAALLFRERELILSEGGMLQGYVPIVWLLILNNALIGLAISAILKFANNLVRLAAPIPMRLLSSSALAHSLHTLSSPLLGARLRTHGCDAAHNVPRVHLHGRALLAAARHVDPHRLSLHTAVQHAPAAEAHHSLRQRAHLAPGVQGRR